jgi:transposase
MVERGCGLDVHQASVVACLMVGPPGKRPHKELRRFGTFTRDLIELRAWLEEVGCTHVAMESTGVFWRPVYAVLEGGFEIVVGNAYHMRNVPGRKTDAKDAEWIADLLRHGLVAKSFVPPKPIRELRDLMRYRRKLVESRATERNRTLKLLETANIKLSTVATSVFGVSGTAMLEALAGGVTDTDDLAGLARGRMRKKHVELTGALDGALTEHHRFLLRLALRRLKAVEVDLAALDRQVAKHLRPYRRQLEALQTIPGIGASTAAVIIAELGVDPTTFPTVGQLVAWGGLCPGNNESAGRNLGARLRKGNPHLRTALVEATMGAIRKRDSYLRAKYYRLKARRGGKRAAIAIAHKLLIAIHHVLFQGRTYVDLGADYLDRQASERTRHGLVRRLERMGFHVELAPKQHPEGPELSGESTALAQP